MHVTSQQHNFGQGFARHQKYVCIRCSKYHHNELSCMLCNYYAQMVVYGYNFAWQGDTFNIITRS